MQEIIANRYVLESLVGQGGMADVYKAHDTILNRTVAIKILRPKLSEDPMILVRFTREASAASRLSHPNVVDIYDVGESGGLHYIVMEYIRGQTLKQMIQRRGAIGVNESLSIMKQLTQAIVQAHDKEIIHRDIKPQNVLVKADGTIKITDFGIAIATGSVSLTHHNAVMGSAHYLAPESAQGKTPDKRVDIYSLGIVFYELLAGQVPYPGSTPTEIAIKHMQEPLPDLKRYNPDIPQSVVNIVMKAAAKDPAERYHSAQELEYDLEHCLDAEHANDKPLVLKTQTIDLSKTAKHKLSESSDTAQNRKSKKASVQHSHPTGQNIIPARKQTSRLSRWASRLILVFLSLMAAFLIAFALMQMGILRISGFAGYVTFPSVADLDQQQAIAKLEELNFDPQNIQIVEEVSDSVDEGKVIDANFTQGNIVRVSDPVTLRISKGSSFLVGDYSGQYLEDVQQQLEEAGVNIEYDINYQGAPNTNPGIILGQSGLYPGDRIDPDQKRTIEFTVSSYPSIIITQNMIGSNIWDLKNQLNAQGIAVSLVDIAGGDTVVDISPAVGSQYTQHGTDSVVVLYH